MGSPWKGFVEFTLPASPPTAFVSADLSSTSPVGLSLSPYGRSVSSTFPPLFYVPHPIEHPSTHLALHLSAVNGLTSFILFGLPRLASTQLYCCRVRGVLLIRLNKSWRAFFSLPSYFYFASQSSKTLARNTSKLCRATWMLVHNFTRFRATRIRPKLALVCS